MANHTLFLNLSTLALALLSLFLDWRQTLQISLHPEKWKEVGWARHFIGENPDPFDVCGYFTICALLTVFATFLVSPWIAGAVAALEGYVVWKNHLIGIK